MTDINQAIAWAEKVAKSKPPRYTDASRNAAQVILSGAEAIKAADELAEASDDVTAFVGYGAHVPEKSDRLYDALAAYRKARGTA